MSDMLKIQNDGPEIVATNFWSTSFNSIGAFYLTIGAGSARLLIPDAQRHNVPEMRRGVKYVVLNYLRSPDTWNGKHEVLEILFEDKSSAPFSIRIGMNQMERIPDSETDTGRRLQFAAYCRHPNVGSQGVKKVIQRNCFVQFVPRLPWLQSIE
jgi:hypothetical protein